MSRVLVLGGGPDAERPVSMESASAIAAALRATGAHEVVERTIDTPTADELAAIAWDVAFPVLHGPWGEGGPMQDLLERTGRPYVGCRPAAARLAMDKLGTKLAAAAAGVPTPPACVVRPGDTSVAVGPPCVIKPVLEGSSVGLHVCRDAGAVPLALDAVHADASRIFMAERMVPGRELTVAVLDGRALPIVEVVPHAGVYDFAAKYERNDTRYSVAPDLPGDTEDRLQSAAEAIFAAIGARHLARIDFMLDAAGTPLLLEANTMPGFTAHSLFPLAAAGAGIELPVLCDRLVSLALRDA